MSALCDAYKWPTTAPGGGVIAIIELGGGWAQADITQFFTNAGLPAPNITDVSVDSTTNSHCNPHNDADAEVALDIQVAGAAYAVATGKAANIRVYWSQDITKAIVAATADGCDVCSISWGADEASWGPAAGNALEQAAFAATNAGMVVFAASGDNDSSDGGQTPANVDLPASAPHVIGCGGTKKLKTGKETVWNDNPGKTDGEGTGGGFSKLFVPMPLWQANAPHGPGRMVPDVAANADPNTGYEIELYGTTEIVGGTSAVAPLYAGLFASFGTKLGFITPELYLNNICFNDITEGDNGAYRASSGPDPCTGLGSPIGAALEERIQPATIHASRLAELLAENAQLRATIAGMGLRPPAAGMTEYVRLPALAALDAAAGCTGSVYPGVTAPSPYQIKSVVVPLAHPASNPSTAGNTPDSTMLIGANGWLGSDPSAMWPLAQSFMVAFAADGLIMNNEEVIKNIKTLGDFVTYVLCCYARPYTQR